MSEWQYMHLSELAEFVLGGDWGKKPDYSNNDYSKVYCIRGAEFKDWHRKKGSTASIRKVKKGSLEKRSLRIGDILIEISGGGPEQPVGRTVLIDKTVVHGLKKYPIVCTNFLRLFRPKAEVNSQWLTFYLTFFYNAGKTIKYQAGSNNLRNLKFKQFEKIKIPIAPLPEQRGIVSKIEQLFSELDNGVSNLKQAKSRLEVYKHAILKKAFEGELTKEWRNNQTALPTSNELIEKIEESRVKFYESQIQEWEKEVNEWNSNGKMGKKPAKPKIAKPLENFSKGELQTFPPLPENWTWSKVDKFAAFDKNSLKAGPFGSSLKKSFYVESGYKIYGQEQVIAGNSKIGNYYVNDDKYQELINCAVKPNDILISLVGTVGKVLILPQDTKEGIINPRLVKITPNEFTNPIYFKYYFESAFLKSLYKAKNHGTTMDVLNLGIIKDLAFPLCSKHEQNEVVKEIESRLSVCDKVLSDIEENLQKTEALRQSILKKAFSGKLLTNSELVACKRAADWEPAEKLIQTIKDANSTKKIAS